MVIRVAVSQCIYHNKLSTKPSIVNQGTKWPWLYHCLIDRTRGNIKRSLRLSSCWPPVLGNLIWWQRCLFGWSLRRGGRVYYTFSTIDNHLWNIIIHLKPSFIINKQQLSRTMMNHHWLLRCRSGFKLCWSRSCRRPPARAKRIWRRLCQGVHKVVSVVGSSSFIIVQTRCFNIQVLFIICSYCHC